MTLLKHYYINSYKVASFQWMFVHYSLNFDTLSLTLYMIPICVLGTHDIQNVSISSPYPGEVRVTGNLVQHANAIGLLAILYSLEIGDASAYYYLEALQRNGMDTVVTSIQGLPGGLYGVSVFVMEESGQPFYRNAFFPKTINVESGEGQFDKVLW